MLAGSTDARRVRLLLFPVPNRNGWIDMARKPETKPKLSDVERHKRFVDMAREVEASDDPKDFERAFKGVATAKSPLKAEKKAKP
jgi:hypothetical protein